MGQVTIYVEDAALNAAKRAAERAQMSVSQWFARFAVEEKQRQAQDWSAFFAEIDRFKPGQADDFPSLEQIRASQVPDVPREAW
jgi:hypothetical protein